MRLEAFSLLLFIGLATAAPNWRVINGTEPRLYEFPSMVSIWMRGMHYCGGTLVDDDTVLTAAHCFSRLPKYPPRGYLHVRINAHNFNNKTIRERQVTVREVITHPRWTPYRLTNDYLILKLSQKVYESATVKYSPLPTAHGVHAVRPRDPCFVVGWGTMDPRGWPGASILQKGAMYVISNEECRAMGRYRRQFQWISSAHICTKSAHTITSACKGDSGGPLFCYPGGRAENVVQVGIVSFGDMPCAQVNMPVAFARISTELNWIRSHF